MHYEDNMVYIPKQYCKLNVWNIVPKGFLLGSHAMASDIAPIGIQAFSQFTGF